MTIKPFTEADRAFFSRLRTWTIGVLVGIFIGRASVIDGFAAGARLFGSMLLVILIAHVTITVIEERLTERVPVEKKDDDATPGH